MHWMEYIPEEDWPNDVKETRDYEAELGILEP